MHGADKFSALNIETEDSRMKKMKRYLVLPLIWVFSAAFCWQFYAGKPIGILQNDALLLAFLLITVGAMDSLVKLIRQWRCKAKDIELPVLSRKEKAVRLGVLAALLLAETVLIIVRQGQSWERPVAEADIEFVSLAQLENEGFVEGSTQRFDNAVSFNTSFAVPKQYDFRMSGKSAEGLPVTMQVCYYEVATEGLAAPLFEAIMEARMDWNQILMQWEMDADVDEAYAAGYMGFQYLFLREGDRMVTVYYYGEQDLTAQAELFVDMIRSGV